MHIWFKLIPKGPPAPVTDYNHKSPRQKLYMLCVTDLFCYICYNWWTYIDLPLSLESMVYLGLTLGAVHSMSLSNCTSIIYAYFTECFHCPKILFCLFIPPFLYVNHQSLLSPQFHLLQNVVWNCMEFHMESIHCIWNPFHMESYNM